MSDSADLADEERNWRAVRKRMASLEAERDQAFSERDGLREELRRARVALELTGRGYSLAEPIAQVVLATEDVQAEDVASVLGKHGRNGDGDDEPTVDDPVLTPDELSFATIREHAASGFLPETAGADG